MTTDLHYMQHALRLARRHIGQTHPNPSVGCVIVKDQRIIGRGITARGGRPHAETIALKQAGNEAQGSTVYVTLEPCTIHGKTPPCADALIKAGIRKIIIATRDLHPDVNGKAIAQFEQAGIEVVENVAQAEASDLNAGFFLKVTKQRPLVTLKLATSLDGKIATASGESKWITSALARNYVHRLRSQHDAIFVGIGTVLADRPMLNCRLSGMEQCSPIRIIMDRQGKIDMDHPLIQTATTHPTWVMTHSTDSHWKHDIEASAAELIELMPDPDNSEALLPLLHQLASRGITRLFVEGGAHIASLLLKQDLVDTLIWIQAPKVIGGDGKNAIESMDISSLVHASHFKQISSFRLDQDHVMVLNKS